MPRLARITIYPIKSLPGLTLSAARLLPSGPLEFDRRWALCDASDKFVNGKRTAAVHGIRAEYTPDLKQVTLATANRPAATFDLADDPTPLEAWLTGHFEFPVHLVESADEGFHDDGEALGPTIVSTATLETVVAWFPELTLDEVRARFRANLELDAADGSEPLPAFWEDRLFGPAGETVPFRIGTARLEGVNPCRRCVVPTRDSRTGAVTEMFARRFSERRQATLPSWVDASRFDHFYRLTVNTRPPIDHGPATISVGDPVETVAAN